MTVIRVFTFRAARRGFDQVLRTEMIPELLAMPGLVDCFSGRQGPDDEGPRVVVSVWSSLDAMQAAVGNGLGTFHPEHLGLTTDHALEILDARVELSTDGPRPRILRILRGAVRAGELDAYVFDAEAGVEADAGTDHAPAAFYLGSGEADGFVTVSAWRDWTDIEQATGGNVHAPNTTRQPDRLTGWDVAHFEIV